MSSPRASAQTSHVQHLCEQFCEAERFRTICVSKRMRRVMQGGNPLRLEAIPTAHKCPFINIQPFVTLFSKGTITFAPLSLFLEHSLTANLTRANHVLYALASFRLVTFSLVFSLCCGILFCGLASQDAVSLWRQSRTLYAFGATIARCCCRRSFTGAICSRPNFGSRGLTGIAICFCTF
jgi:hypothetical protein